MAHGFSKMRVLVTGGAGYIGSHLCQALAEAGCEVLVYDDLSTGHREFVQWGGLFEGDVADEAALSAAFSQFKPQAVVHFAALATLGASLQQPLECYHANVQGVVTLLRVMRRFDCRHLVFSSSCSVYQVPENNEPLSEATPYGPSTPYAASKMMAERILFDIERKTDIRAVMLRYFNAAGADPQARVGEWHEPETHALPLAIAAAHGRGAFRIFGTDYPTPDGTAIRDYIHVTDLADAHLRALGYLQGGGATVALNVGTGQGVSVRELLRAVEKACGQSFEVMEAPRREGDPVRLVADARKVRQVLGWQPVHSELATIVETAMRWHRKCWNA